MAAAAITTPTTVINIHSLFTQQTPVQVFYAEFVYAQLVALQYTDTEITAFSLHARIR